MKAMAEELLTILTRFHRDVFVPDIERILDAKLGARIGGLRHEMLANFDAVFERLDQLASALSSRRSTSSGRSSSS